MYPELYWRCTRNMFKFRDLRKSVVPEKLWHVEIGDVTVSPHQLWRRRRRRSELVNLPTDVPQSHQRDGQQDHGDEYDQY